MPKIFLFLTLSGWLYALPLCAQETDVSGVILDKETHYRVTRVFIRNLRTNVAIYNNTKGEFSVKAREGDKITALVDGYHPDTVVFRGQSALAFYLQRRAIPLQEIVVTDSAQSARRRYDEILKNFNSLNRLGNNRDILAIGNGGAGFSIDALWSAFSREGRNARRLSSIIERDYQNNLIDERFTKNLVKEVTGLKGEDLTVFMIRYRPAFFFVDGASEYDLVSYVKMAYIRFKQNRYEEDFSQLKPIIE